VEEELSPRDHYLDKPSPNSSSSGMAEIHDQFDTILILDFGSQVHHHVYINYMLIDFNDSTVI